MASRVYSSTNNGFPHGELMYARESLRKGAISQQEYSRMVEEKVVKIMTLQEEFGIDVVTGGAYGWDDIFSPFFNGGVTGLQRDGLIRFFDNNTYYRKPVIIGRLEHTQSSVKPMVEGVLKHVKEPSKFKAFLPGPYTFAALSENTFYPNLNSLISDLAGLLRIELEGILGLGVGYVEVCDPSLGWLDPAKAEELKPVYREFLGDNAHRVWFTLPFREPNPSALKMLLGLGDVVVSLDLSSTTLHRGANVNDNPGWLSSAKTILNGLSSLLGGARVDLGLVDSRNTLLEDVSYAKQIIDHALSLHPKEVYLSNNASLDFLPEPVAFEKVRLIGRLKREVNASG
ncbi:hypothetical protein B9Q09_04485 [Candidatus Marsarchaeota G2 archaeon ECH_B_SAG-C16]|uniref:Cobalamin-independent methionine synthase MetE C-terminal/archaeal domain-containing protein n=1 Tax=Candidatus Marsarchaeota G2 archaeon ECH_B_SAG-C16 TaxID=1978163 RepID=A0A2R6B6A9_9ARCH|nr:MAG: hypothetical protein B9Q09_04485 [Candidatus Marsarchaeota G2 archaeon ECH_B_SAG-C16]